MADLSRLSEVLQPPADTPGKLPRIGVPHDKRPEDPVTAWRRRFRRENGREPSVREVTDAASQILGVGAAELDEAAEAKRIALAKAAAAE